MRLKMSVLMAVLGLMVAGGACAAEANAVVWKFNGHELVGEETVGGTASPGTIALLGSSVTCADVALRFGISNTGGNAVGENYEVPFFECTSAIKECTLATIQAKHLPWPLHAVTPISVSSTSNYLVFEKARIELVFTGALCPIAGVVELRGSMGGLFRAGSVTFDKASYEATKTGFSVGTEKAELDGAFPLEALGSHHGETLELGP